MVERSDDIKIAPGAAGFGASVDPSRAEGTTV